ncbi:MAG: hypothetical protein L3J34_01770 [Flavobacteriaceae bacterium]|nr:hypothetical protein [Flavobacteriaceae bacterium]
MGEITNVSYFTSSEPCGMNMETHDFNNQNFQNEKCCNDIQQLISGNKNEQQALDKLEINNVKFILAYTYTYLNLFEKRDDISTFIDTSPHILDRDYQVLYQTFLI